MLKTSDRQFIERGKRVFQLPIRQLAAAMASEQCRRHLDVDQLGSEQPLALDAVAQRLSHGAGVGQQHHQRPDVDGDHS